MVVGVKALLKRRGLHYGLAACTVLPIVVALSGWWLLTPLDGTPYTDVVASGQLLDRHGARLYVALSGAETWSLPQASEGLSPYLFQATLAAEDQRFYQHPGVDPVAILRAVGQNVRQGGVASGASTLTMQLVKLGGHDSASVSGKLGQALAALRLEKSLSKDEILGAYLNQAPYGMNLVGAEAAAWRYFGKTARTLNLPEAALLAGLPKAPSRLNPLKYPERARHRRDYVLHRMWAEGFIDAGQRDRALAAPVRATWHDFPRHAPHLAIPYDAILARGEIQTLTLDGALQRKTEERLPEYLKRFDGAISNGAVVVVDVGTGALLARVGSASFTATPGGGEVDSCRAVRSPGSTLKPFLYGLAMARQQLYPTEVLLDDVLDYGRYAPGNFDGLFNGPVTATEALRFSLNVPAVALLDRVGVAQFYDVLRGAGLASIDRPAADYGLGLALGNCEVSLEGLAALYLSVASLGAQNVLHLDAESTELAQKALFAPDLCRALYDMLAQAFPEEPDEGLIRRDGNASPVAWKTGTSTGYHDAWTFAFNQHYLVGVWLGNNDGTSARPLVGAYSALPLAAQVFRDLPVPSRPAWPTMVSGRPATLCALSGLPVNTACVDQVSAVLPEGLWLHRRCTLHGVSQTGLGVVAKRPPVANAWNLAAVAGRSVESTEETVSITSPPEGSAYVLSGVADGDQLRLTATMEGHWFVDGRYLGESHPGEPVEWPMTLGEHRATVQLNSGGQATSAFTVVRPSAVAFTP